MTLNVRRYIFGSPDSRFALSRYDIGDGTPYMRRWSLHTPWGSLRVHNILRSDKDRALHDHPMDFWTLLLTGGYTEVLPVHFPACGAVKCTATKRVWRRWLSIRFVPAEHPHRLVLDRPIWTLVWAGPPRRRWGFYVGGFAPENWVDSKEHLRPAGGGDVLE